MWKHLYRGDDAHRLAFFDLKSTDGQLAAAGQEEMQALRNSIAAGLNPAVVFVKPFQAAAKNTMDRVWWSGFAAPSNHTTLPNKLRSNA
jgi:hypothetical protein